ncbi:MAG: ubiquinol-cytochrome c reductase iron-sulfur subunit [Bacteroidales bacterium]|nr:ubiquinol-cytochrome c reductase iron-sulfur subunit [Bacteroidales bacterium]
MEPEEAEPKSYSRRQFFRHLSWSVLGFAGLAAVPFVVSSLIPRKVIENKRIRIGKPGDFPINRMTYLPDSHLYILRDPSGIAAMSAICTHLGCVVEQDVSGFLCPCHGSSFSLNGVVEKGPAPRNLPWYRVSTLPDQSLVVNMNQQVSPETRLQT